MKSWYSENNLWKKLQQLTIFAACSIVDVWQGSEYAWASDFEYTRVLNLPQYAWIIFEHPWICPNMPKYVWVCLNLPKWLLFYFPIVIPCLLEYVVTYFNVFRKLQVIVWRNKRLFLEETKFNFFHSSWKYLICFLF